MKFVYNDGGRAEAGYIGDTRDCVCRAIAIAAQRPYKEVYDLINKYAKKRAYHKAQPETVERSHRLPQRNGTKDTQTLRLYVGCNNAHRARLHRAFTRKRIAEGSHCVQSFGALCRRYRRCVARYIRLHPRRLPLCLRLLHKHGRGTRRTGKKKQSGVCLQKPCTDVAGGGC